MYHAESPNDGTGPSRTPLIMKKLFLFAFLCIAGLAQLGCGNDKKETPDPKPEPVRLDRDTVTRWLSRRSFMVTDAWRFAGKDSVDMFKADSLYRLFAEAAFLHFYMEKGAGPVMFHSGRESPNTTIPGNARTFGMNIRIFLPTEMEASWDEDRGTVRIDTKRTTYYFPMIVPGKTGYLDPASFNVKMWFDEAKAAKVKPSMRFIYEDEDPKLGKVTYKITMKPLYEYYREPNQQAFAMFALFP